VGMAPFGAASVPFAAAGRAKEAAIVLLNPGDPADLRRSTPEQTADGLSQAAEQRGERARGLAEQIMADPRAGAHIKDRIRAMGGDYSSPAAQAELNGKPDHRASTLSEAIDHIASVSEPLHQRVTVKPIPRDSGAGANDESAADPVRVERAAPMKPVDTDEDDEAKIAAGIARLERLAEQILHELRRRRDEPNTDFSVPRLLAGVTQVITLAVLFMSYLNRGTASFQPMLLLALCFQTFTIALLIMGRMR